MPGPYTQEEDAYLAEHYHRVGLQAIADHLGRSPSSVGNRAMRLRSRGLIVIPAGTRSVRWTQEDDDYLFTNWGVVPDGELCRRLNRTLYAVMQRAWLLGATKRDNQRHTY